MYKQIQEQSSTENKAHYELKKDSVSYHIVPAIIDEKGEEIMSLEIEEIVVRSSFKMLPERKGVVSIDFIITLPKDLQGNCKSVTIAPFLHNSQGKQALEELSIRGGLFDKVQSRNYWQYEQYVKLFKPNAMERERAFQRFVKYPYPKGVRLDSIAESKASLVYYYNQEVSTKGEGKSMKLTLEGRVNALDGSYYKLPVGDTLTYTISSMINFADQRLRYITKVIEKYVVLTDKNYLSFNQGQTNIIDTLEDNKNQLQRIESLMEELVNHKEFHVDSILLCSSASPEGSYSLNTTLSRGRAMALRDRLCDRFGDEIKSIISVKSLSEDWAELYKMISASNLKHKSKILKIIESTANPDLREQKIKEDFPLEYEQIVKTMYPKLRCVTFKYDLRRVGMVKDTVHTTMVDTLYMRALSLLQDREYEQSYKILRHYGDYNCALVMTSLGYDKAAYNLLSSLEQTDMTYYLRAILCSRLGFHSEGRECFTKACNLNSTLEYRGKLDPEISNLLASD